MVHGSGDEGGLVIAGRTLRYEEYTESMVKYNMIWFAMVYYDLL